MSFAVGLDGGRRVDGRQGEVGSGIGDLFGDGVPTGCGESRLFSELLRTVQNSVPLQGTIEKEW